MRGNRQAFSQLKLLDTYFENLDLQCENNSLFEHKSLLTWKYVIWQIWNNKGYRMEPFQEWRKKRKLFNKKWKKVFLITVTALSINCCHENLHFRCCMGRSHQEKEGGWYLFLCLIFHFGFVNFLVNYMFWQYI